MMADFRAVELHMHNELLRHADLDGLVGVKRAVFLDRGGHAPGEHCPSEAPRRDDGHQYWCHWPGEECEC